MKGKRVTELTGAEFEGLAGTELYSVLLAHKFLLEFTDDDEFEKLCNTINAVTSGPWYFKPYQWDRTFDVSAYEVYVSCPEGEETVLGALGLLP